MKWFPNYKFILASKSPRRQELLKSLGIDFEVKLKEVEETYPNHLKQSEIPVYLAELKAKAFQSDLKENEVLITADTVVYLEDKVLGKPQNYEDAFQMLSELSNKEHQVITGVTLTTMDKMTSFYASTKVQFKALSNDEINYYVETYKPFDKAGAYGIQEWIGTIGIDHIEGSFYNVMGLPIQKLYEEIQKL